MLTGKMIMIRCLFRAAAPRKILGTMLVFAAAPPLQAAGQLYDHGDPAGEEQYMLELINRARAQPMGEGARWISTENPNVIAAYNWFNVDPEKLLYDFAGYHTRPPLAFNADLIEAARRHAWDMTENDFQQHTGSDGSSMPDRVSEAGYDYNYIGENIFAYAEDLMHGHGGMIVDWGYGDEYGIQDPPNHRVTIMNLNTGKPFFREAGIGIYYEDDPGTEVGPWVMSQEFGYRTGRVFLCGVAYEDLDGDGFYSPGEGIGGITFTPSAGDYYAVTSDSGGYAIPIGGLDGTLTVTASGGPLSEPLSISMRLLGVNVKLDLADGALERGETIFDIYKEAEGGLKRSFWLDAWMSLDYDPWVYHYGLGWIYYYGVTSENVFFYDPALGWMWTGKDVYPFLYSYKTGGWLWYYHNPAANRRWFKDFNDGLDKPEDEL